MIPMKIMVAGCQGFLGAALVQWIAVNKPSIKVVGVSRRKKSKDVFRCDLSRPSNIIPILKKYKPDIIFHAAGGRGGSDEEMFRDNIHATFSLFEALKAVPAIKPRVVMFGSAAEYGNAFKKRGKVAETVTPDPASAYGFIKTMQIALGQFYSRQGFNVVGTRIFNVSGKGTRPDLALGNFARQIVLIERGQQKPVIKTRGLGDKRDFLDVADVCSALWEIAQKGKSGEIYNICSADGFCMRDLLKRMIHFSKRQDIRVQELKRDVRGFDAVGDNRKLCRIAKWKSYVTIDESLKNTLQYYRQP